jgi:hypothetical protein
VHHKRDPCRRDLRKLVAKDGSHAAYDCGAHETRRACQGGWTGIVAMSAYPPNIGRTDATAHEPTCLTNESEPALDNDPNVLLKQLIGIAVNYGRLIGARYIVGQ